MHSRLISTCESLVRVAEREDHRIVQPPKQKSLWSKSQKEAIRRMDLLLNSDDSMVDDESRTQVVDVDECLVVQEPKNDFQVCEI